MTDLHTVLPDFSTADFSHLMHNLEKHRITTTDLLTLDVSEIGKRAQLPLMDLKRLSAAILNALHADLGVSPDSPADNKPQKATTSPNPPHPLRTTLSTPHHHSPISTLTPTLDLPLGGGIPTGQITEITGESGAGKTQLLLSLLLASQLPPPHGTSRPALYITTEAPLNTRRLTQLLTYNPLLAALPTNAKPTLDGIATIPTPDLESQEHILTYQVPVFAAQRNLGLLVIDSVAANYRVEYDRNAKTPRANGSGANLAARAGELARLGMLLRNLAQRFDMAVVVANQVADRFVKEGGPGLGIQRLTQESPLARKRGPPGQMGGATPLKRARAGTDGTPGGSQMPASSRAAVPEGEPGPSPPRPPASMASEMRGYTYGRDEQTDPCLSLDYQQQWFTGWGDDPYRTGGLKTPSLGLVWSTQVAMRIALLKEPVMGGGGGERAGGTLKSWRRWMKIVYAPHVKPSGAGVQGAVEYEIWNGGLRAVDGGDEAGDGR